MIVSIFDLFKIGIGPSSSHTYAPMMAAYRFINKQLENISDINHITVELFGSLAFTGKGHGTDKAIIIGLSGYMPDRVDKTIIDSIITNLSNTKNINLLSRKNIKFEIDKNIIFNFKISDKPYSNTMLFKAYDNANNLIIKEYYYSIGGGFIITDSNNSENEKSFKIPYKYDTGNELLTICKREKMLIHELVLKNEKSIHPEKDVKNEIMKIWSVMNKSIYNGMTNSGVLEGKINLKRRANILYKKLIRKGDEFDPLYIMDWVNIFAISVSEENASFGKIVTAPTNGAAGIIPSVIKYYVEFVKDASDEGIIRFLLTCTAIGYLFKKNASISGAEAGCQGEVGVACSMAAAGLASALKGTNEQIENAAEIAMEHNLGLTCDPVGGLVQVPCIERNAMGSIKAINSARLALSGSGEHKVSLDEVIQTMWETGKNMSSIYKETSKGGLAVNVIEC